MNYVCTHTWEGHICAEKKQNDNLEQCMPGKWWYVNKSTLYCMKMQRKKLALEKPYTGIILSTVSFTLMSPSYSLDGSSFLELTNMHFP